MTRGPHPPTPPRRRILLTRRPVLAIALILAATICLLVFLARPDPRETDWQAALDAGLPILVPSRARNDFAPILNAGPDAIPFLLSQLEGTWWDRFKDRHWDDIPPVLRDRLKKPFPYRGQIPQVLELMNPTPKAALPRMREIFRQNPRENLNLFNAIARIGQDDPATLDFLLETSLTQNPSDSFKYNATSFLGSWSPSQKVANALTNFLHDPDPWIVGNTLVSLNRLGPAYLQPHLSLVTNALHSSDPDIRDNALRILASLNKTNSTTEAP